MPRLTPLAALALALAPVATAAQDAPRDEEPLSQNPVEERLEGEGSVAERLEEIDLLGGSDEERLPETAWQETFMGRYAVGGACDDPQSIWILTDFVVQFGSRRCSTMGKLTWEEGYLIAPLTDCRDGAREIPRETLGFAEREGGGLHVIGLEEPVSLEACPGEF